MQSLKMQAVNLVTEEGYSYKKAGDTISASKTKVIGWVMLVELHGVIICPAMLLNLSKTQIQRWERIYFEEGAEAEWRMIIKKLKALVQKRSLQNEQNKSRSFKS